MLEKVISKGVALRLRRICSIDNDFFQQAKMYKAYLASCGHHPRVINTNCLYTSVLSRNDVRKKQPKKGNLSTMCITKYNPKGPKIKQILSKHQEILKNDPIASKIFPPSSIQTVFKRHSNLKQLLIRADPYNIQSKQTCHSGGTSHCGLKCDACTFLVHSSSFVCFATGRRFYIRKIIS